MALMLRVLIVLMLYFPVTCLCQKNNAVQWEFSSGPPINNEVTLTLKASIAPGWHLYSQFIKDGGPIPTRISFDQSFDFMLIGKTEESGNSVKFHDEVYEMEITWYSETVSFFQKIKLNQLASSIKGSVEYMTCNSYICAPDKQDFVIEIRPPKFDRR